MVTVQKGQTSLIVFFLHACNSRSIKDNLNKPFFWYLHFKGAMNWLLKFNYIVV